MVERDALGEALNSLAAHVTDDGRFIADVREWDAHHSRIAQQPVVERRAAELTFRASRSMGDDHVVSSREQFAVSGRWSEPFEFKMRTFTENEVRDLWQEASLEVLTIEHSYGPGSRLEDRLIVVSRRCRPCRRPSPSTTGPGSARSGCA